MFVSKIFHGHSLRHSNSLISWNFTQWLQHPLTIPAGINLHRWSQNVDSPTLPLPPHLPAVNPPQRRVFPLFPSNTTMSSRILSLLIGLRSITVTLHFDAQITPNLVSGYPFRLSPVSPWDMCPSVFEYFLPFQHRLSQEHVLSLPQT